MFGTPSSCVCIKNHTLLDPLLIQLVTIPSIERWLSGSLVVFPSSTDERSDLRAPFVARFEVLHVKTWSRDDTQLESIVFFMSKHLWRTYFNGHVCFFTLDKRGVQTMLKGRKRGERDAGETILIQLRRKKSKWLEALGIQLTRVRSEWQKTSPPSKSRVARNP